MSTGDTGDAGDDAVVDPGTGDDSGAVVRRLDSPPAAALARLVDIFDDLQTVLRCCERLVAELAREDSGPDDLVVEALWTTAVLSYARCFTAGAGDAALTEADLSAAQPTGDVLGWHEVLVSLRDHYADGAANPRERFSVGVAQGADGAAQGVAITSARQPLVDDVTVRQTGAVAFALSRLVDQRIEDRQRALFDEVKDAPRAELDKLVRLEVSGSIGRS